MQTKSVSLTDPADKPSGHQCLKRERERERRVVSFASRRDEQNKRKRDDSLSLFSLTYPTQPPRKSLLGLLDISFRSTSRHGPRPSLAVGISHLSVEGTVELVVDRLEVPVGLVHANLMGFEGLGAGEVKETERSQRGR